MQSHYFLAGFSKVIHEILQKAGFPSTKLIRNSREGNWLSGKRSTGSILPGVGPAVRN